MRHCFSTAVAVMCAVGWALGGLTDETPGGQANKQTTTQPQKTELRAPEVKQPLALAGGMPLVEVMINGAGPFKLAIDTGTTETTIDDDVVKKLGLEIPEPADSPTTGEEKVPTSPTVRLISVTLGDAVFFDLKAKVVDYDKEAEGERLFDGTLGLPPFSDFLLTLDYPGEQIIITRGELPAPDGKEVLAYVDKQGLATIPLTFDGITTEVTIVSGYEGGFTLASSLRGHVKMAPKAYEERQRRRLTDEEKKQERQIMSTVPVGKHKVFQPPVRFLQAESEGTSRVGHRVLQHFALTIDQKNHRIGLSRKETGNVTFGPPQPRFGVVFYAYGRYLKVKEVIPDSPAGRSPITVGDKIEWVDARKPNEYGFGDLVTFIEEAEAFTFSINRRGAILHVTLRPWD